MLRKRHELTWNANIFTAGMITVHTVTLMLWFIGCIRVTDRQENIYFLFCFSSLCILLERLWVAIEVYLVLVWISGLEIKPRHTGEWLYFHLWLANVHISLHKNCSLGVLVTVLTLEDVIGLACNPGPLRVKWSEVYSPGCEAHSYSIFFFIEYKTLH